LATDNILDRGLRSRLAADRSEADQVSKPSFDSEKRKTQEPFPPSPRPANCSPKTLPVWKFPRLEPTAAGSQRVLYWLPSAIRRSPAAGGVPSPTRGRAVLGMLLAITIPPVAVTAARRQPRASSAGQKTDFPSFSFMTRRSTRREFTTVQWGG